MFESARAEASPVDMPQRGLAAKLGDGSRRVLYFYHVPKTGGHTVVMHIVQRYGTSGVVSPSKNKSLVCDIFLQKKFIVPPSFGDKPIVGHFASFSLMRGRESNYYKACFWRHPAKWQLSFYNFRHHRNSHRIKRKFGFADFCRSMLRNPMTEHLLLYCADVRGWSYFFMSDKRKFDLACATIERFDRFEDIAKVDDYLEFIGSENSQKPKDYNRSSRAGNTLQHLDEATIAKIERQNPVDLLLHKISLGEEIQAIRKEAASILNRAFDPRDIVRLLLLPYYRYKIWVVPFGWRRQLGRTKVCSIGASSEPETRNSIQPFGTFPPNRLQNAVRNIGHRLPRNWPGNRFYGWLRSLLRRTSSQPIDVTVLGQRMRLHLGDNACEARLMVTPQLFDPEELEVLRSVVRPGFQFVDLGANVGAYSIFVGRLAGPDARILAVEPQDALLERLRENIALNALNIRIAPVAVADRDDVIDFSLNLHNRGCTSLHLNRRGRGGRVIRLPVRKLLGLVKEHGFERIDALKADIEGAEDLALLPFMEEAPPSLWPKLIIMESGAREWRRDCVAFLLERGYERVQTRGNIVLRLPRA